MSMLEQLAAWGAAAIGLGGTGLLLARRASKVRTEAARDSAERDIVELLLEERKQALERWQEAAGAHLAAVETVSTLRAQLESQARELQRLRAEFAAFKRLAVRVNPEIRAWLASEPGVLG